MTAENGDLHCKDCISWFKLSDKDGGIGICDSIVSDHNQHLLGFWHPACDAALTEANIHEAVEHGHSRDEAIEHAMETR